MTIKDIKSELVVNLALLAAISGNGTTTAATTLDVADFDLGIMLAMQVSNFTDGSYELQVFESETGAFAGEENQIAAEADIGVNDITGGVFLGEAPTLTAASAEFADLSTVGIIGNKRFLQIRIVATGVSAGADVTIIATLAKEISPV